MNRADLIRIVSDIKEGHHTTESLQHAITAVQLPKDTRSMLQLEALEKTVTLVQRQDPGFVEKARKLNADLKSKYGLNAKQWPDEALDELWNLYVTNPIYAKMLTLDIWLNNNHLKKFIQWTNNELATLKS